MHIPKPASAGAAVSIQPFYKARKSADKHSLLHIVPDFRGLSSEQSERFINGLERGNAKQRF